jgi:hypothetical protein
MLKHRSSLEGSRNDVFGRESCVDSDARIQNSCLDEQRKREGHIESALFRFCDQLVSGYGDSFTAPRT